jgi:hypothetical protein
MSRSQRAQQQEIEDTVLFASRRSAERRTAYHTVETAADAGHEINPRAANALSRIEA